MESTSVLQKRHTHRDITYVWEIACACLGWENRFPIWDDFDGNYARVVPIRQCLTPPRNPGKTNLIHPDATDALGTRT